MSPGNQSTQRKFTATGDLNFTINFAHFLSNSSSLVISFVNLFDKIGIKVEIQGPNFLSVQQFRHWKDEYKTICLIVGPMSLFDWSGAPAPQCLGFLPNTSFVYLNRKTSGGFLFVELLSFFCLSLLGFGAHSIEISQITGKINKNIKPIQATNRQPAFFYSQKNYLFFFFKDWLSDTAE